MPALSPTRATSLAKDGSGFNGRMFVRLCAWVSAAMVALVIAVAAGRTELGSERAHAALVAMLSPPAASDRRSDQQLSEQMMAWSESVDKQMRRQAEAIRTLTEDRQALLEKLGAMERQVGDLGGTLARSTARFEADLKTVQQVAAAASAAAATRLAQARPDPPEPATLAAPATAAARMPPAREAAAPPNPVPLGAVHPGAPAYTGTIPMPTATTPETNGPPGMTRPFPVQAPPQAAAEPAVATPRPRPNEAKPGNPSTPLYGPLFQSNPLMTTGILGAPMEPGAISAEFAIDLGSAATIDALRTRWGEIRTSQSPLFDNLRPLVAIKDGGKGAQELHLVAGPLTTTAASARMCAVLSGTGVPCQATVYEGQRLTAR
jgi:hypothetical protein